MKSIFAKLATAAAVSLAFAAPASAAVGKDNTSTLFFEAFDSVTGKTYIRDLQVSMNDFGTANRALTGGNGPTTGIPQPFTNIRDDSVTDSQTFTPDSKWTDFMTGVTASNVVYDVIAVDANGTGSADRRRVMFTSLSNAEQVIAQPGVQQANVGFTGIGGINQHIDAINAVIGSNTSLVSTSTGDPYSYIQFKSDNLNAGLSPSIGVTSAGFGQSMGFYYMTRSSTDNDAEAIARAFGVNGLTTAAWNLAADGTLSYNVSAVVAAVPEPGTWAMTLAGALMLGGIARRRMS